MTTLPHEVRLLRIPTKLSLALVAGGFVIFGVYGVYALLRARRAPRRLSPRKPAPRSDAGEHAADRHQLARGGLSVSSSGRPGPSSVGRATDQRRRLSPRWASRDPLPTRHAARPPGNTTRYISVCSSLRSDNIGARPHLGRGVHRSPPGPYGRSNAGGAIGQPHVGAAYRSQG